jgi:23S rRNA pseudouridine1911/1915/1917 synthase
VGVFEYEGEIGKHAITHYKLLRDMQYVSLVECKLETGRTHQIRVHMQHIQHPVFNDNEYGGDKIIKGLPTANYKRFIENCFELIPGQALHARTLELTHPATGERMRFEKELPEGFQAIIERFEKAQLSV